MGRTFREFRAKSTVRFSCTYTQNGQISIDWSILNAFMINMRLEIFLVFGLRARPDLENFVQNRQSPVFGVCSHFGPPVAGKVNKLEP